jgi:hypothetical protein
MAEQHVFISYAHIDNLPFGPRQSQWVSEFAVDLQRRLTAILGTEAMIWRDPRLRGQQPIWRTIEGTLVASRVFISIISPRYVHSDSCRQEWQFFERSRSVDRMLHVIKLPVELDLLPSPYRDRPGYPFFTSDLGGEYPYELDRDNTLYWKALNELAVDVRHILLS